MTNTQKWSGISLGAAFALLFSGLLIQAAGLMAVSFLFNLLNQE